MQVATGMDIGSYRSAAESFERMKADYQFFQQAYEDHSQNALRRYILEYFQDLYEKAAKERLGVDRLDAQTRYSIRMFIHGGIAMSWEWLQNDTAEPAIEVTKMMFESMPENLKEIFRDPDTDGNLLEVGTPRA